MNVVVADFAYGAEEIGEAIPANADLVFDVELISINGKKRVSEQALVDYRAQLDKWLISKVLVRAHL